MKTPQEFRDAIQKINQLSPSAAVFARAHRLISSPGAQLEDVANAIKMDTVLTADIIRLSNSAAAGSNTPIADLKTAIGRVGFKEVDRYLGLSLSKSVMNRNLQCYGITAYEYWSNSISVAIFMELLAARMDEDIGEAHTLGILHAIGRLVINQILDDMRMTIYWDEKMPIETWEMESVGFTYTTAGALLLNGWGFPQTICENIENQLCPDQITNPSHLLKMLNFCLHLLLGTGIAFANTDWLPSDSSPFLIEFGITLDEVNEIIHIARKKYLETQSLLGISVVL